MSKFSFNRPRLYSTFLSAAYCSDNKPFEVYSTVIADDITVRTPDALLSGTATIELIQNCCPSISNAAEVLVCDIPALLCNIRIASDGMKLELNATCPGCSTQNTYEINLNDILVRLSAEKWFTPLILPDDNLKIIFYPPSYETYNNFAIEEFKLKKQLFQITQLASFQEHEHLISALLEQQQKNQAEYYSNCITRIEIDHSQNVTNPNHIKEWFGQADLKICEQIKQHITAALEQCNLPKLSIKCDTCNVEYSSPVDIDHCNHFRQKLIQASESDIVNIIESMDKEIKSITADMLKLCWFMRGSISYSEAFGLTNIERDMIGKIIQENIEISKKINQPIF